MEVSQKDKNRTTIWPSSTFSGHAPKLLCVCLTTGSYSVLFILALCTAARKWNQPRCPPADEQIIKYGSYIVELYSAINKNENMKLVAKRGMINYYIKFQARR